MLIPSIDLQNGNVVQLVQGEKLAITASDAEPWIAKFSRFPRVQLIDLDAAMGKGDNGKIVAAICRRLRCRVGGGIRSIDRARTVLESGAHAVIASSALFRDGAVDVGFAEALAMAVGREHVIAGTDCGFAQGPFHRRVHPSIMWAKLEALAAGARLASKELWN